MRLWRRFARCWRGSISRARRPILELENHDAGDGLIATYGWSKPPEQSGVARGAHEETADRACRSHGVGSHHTARYINLNLNLDFHFRRDGCANIRWENRLGFSNGPGGDIGGSGSG